jgi:predicted metal-dependent peptidase
MQLTKEIFEINLSAASLHLMTNAPFFGALLYATDVTLDESENPLSCAWTDGDEIFFNLAVMQEVVDDITKKNAGTRSEKKVVFEALTVVIIHELMHCMFIHVGRISNRNPLTWNLATDIAVNTLITHWFSHLHMPDIMLTNKVLPYNLKEGSAELIYEHLVKTAKIEKTGGGRAKVTMAGGKGNGVEQEEGIEFIVDLVSNPEKDSGEIEDKWRAKIETAKQANDGVIAPKNAGRSSQSLEDMLDELYAPKVDWRDLICNLGGELSKGDYSFMRRAKKSIPTNYYMPSLRTYEPFVLVAIDVSGSISKEEYKRFMSEVQGILGLHNCKVGVLQCDTEIKGYVELSPGDDAPRLRGGCGGTLFAPVFDYAENHISANIDAMLFFTDGYNGDRGFESKRDVMYPLIWVMTTDHAAPKIGNSMRYDPHV